MKKKKQKDLPPQNTHCAGCGRISGECPDKKLQRVRGENIEDGYYCNDCKGGMV